MQISERQKNILDTIIREYVESARPVSSQYLGEKFDFGICPASIRIEMQKLTDDGFLEQPHTSAGRVPTDKGYRFFVDTLLVGESKLAGILDFDAENIEDEFEDVFKLANALTRSLAQASSSLVLGYLRQEDVLWKEGWEDLLQNPEFGDKIAIENFINYLGYLEDNVKTRVPEAKPDIYIGGENRFSKAGEFSVITFALQPDEREEVILSIVGPKRMAYERNIALTNEVLKLFENL
jgi:transcriptional regulator of heat shock response